jgi:hypothetical protein
MGALATVATEQRVLAGRLQHSLPLRAASGRSVEGLCTEKYCTENILREVERRVIVSLRRVVDNPRSELERAWDWVSGDPDFRVMRDNREKFTAFGEFLDELERHEYPASMVGKCPAPHTKPAGILAVAAIRLTSAEPAIFSPVPSPVPVGDGEHAYRTHSRA